MPFVNIRILKGHSQQRKDEMSRRITAAISEIAALPNEAIWVVFEDVTADDWYVGASAGERTSEGCCGGENQDMTVEIRHPAFDPLSAHLLNSRSSGPASCSPKARCGMPQANICCSATCRETGYAAGRQMAVSSNSGIRATSRTA